MTTDIADIIVVVSVLALVLLLLTAVVDPPAAGGRGHRPALPERPDTTEQRRQRRQVKETPPTAAERTLWLVRPGAAAVDDVPADVQAEALEILNTLRSLDAYFTESPHPPRRNGS